MRGLWLRQNEQVHARSGLSSGGFASRMRTWMLPQWQPPKHSIRKTLGIPVGVSMGSLNSLAYWTDAVGAFTHGSSAIRMIRAQASGMPVCLTVTRHDAGFGMFGLTPLSQLSMRHGLRPSTVETVQVVRLRR